MQTIQAKPFIFYKRTNKIFDVRKRCFKDKQQRKAEMNYTLLEFIVGLLSQKILFI